MFNWALLHSIYTYAMVQSWIEFWAQVTIELNQHYSSYLIISSYTYSICNGPKTRDIIIEIKNKRLFALMKVQLILSLLRNIYICIYIAIGIHFLLFINLYNSCTPNTWIGIYRTWVLIYFDIYVCFLVDFSGYIISNFLFLTFYFQLHFCDWENN